MQIGRRELICSLHTANRFEAERLLALAKSLIWDAFAMCDQCPNPPFEALYDLVHREFWRRIKRIRDAIRQASSPGATPVLSFDEWIDGRKPIDESDIAPAPSPEMAEKVRLDRERLEQEIEQLNFARADPIVTRLLTEGGHSVPQSTRNHELISTLVMRSLEDQARFKEFVYRKGFDTRQWSTKYPWPAVSWPKSDRPSNEISAGMVDGESALGDLDFSSLCKTFLKERSREVKERSLEKDRYHLTVIGELLGARQRVIEIDKATVKRLRDRLTGLPSNFRKKFPGKSALEVLALPEEQRYPVLKAASLNAFLASLSAMFSYAERMGMIDRNPVKGMGFRDPENPKDKRLPFKSDQITAIFSLPIFHGCDGCHWQRKGETRLVDERFWVPLISLFSGMRRGEIMNLRPENFIDRDGIWLMEITEGKTPAAKRKVPVHSKLIEIGLLGFIATCPKGKPIFGSMTADALGKAFARLLVACGINDPKLTFHSLRHTFIERAVNAGVLEERIGSIVGHASTSQTARTYGNPDNSGAAGVLKNSLELVQFGEVDWSKLSRKSVSVAQAVPI